jgi:hypothetical protein
VTVLAWQDKKRVTFISTFHNGEMSTTSKDGKDTIKPKEAFDYNTNMGSVSLNVVALPFGTQEREQVVDQIFQ